MKYTSSSSHTYIYVHQGNYTARLHRVATQGTQGNYTGYTEYWDTAVTSVHN